MATFFITLGAFLFAVSGLAVGVILSNREIKGSCGGLGTIKDDHGRSMCMACTNPPENCSRKRDAIAAEDNDCDEHDHDHDHHSHATHA